MFFKIGALKNFATFRIKKRLQRKLFDRAPPVAASAFLTALSQRCGLQQILKKCSVYDVLIIFFSTRFRDTLFDV